MLRGKGLQVVDMDSVLSLSHLKLKESLAVLYYGVGTIVQRRQLRVVAVAADHNAIRSAQHIQDVLWRCAACCGVVMGVARRCCFADGAEGLQSLFQRPLGVAGRFSGMA